MQVQIDTNPSRTLSVIPGFPDARLVKLEGLNGIGKTSAVRLLMLCTGAMPYGRTSAAWRSFCRNLGEFTVTVSNLQDVQSLVWVANTHDWYDEDSDQPLPIVFQSITIDGVAGTIDDVRQHLGVYRIAGDESLLETLASDADMMSETISRWRTEFADESASAIAQIEERVAAATDALEGPSLEDYREDKERIQADAERLRSLRREVAEASRELENLAAASRLDSQLRALEMRTPELLVRLDSVEEELGALTSERQGLDRKRKEASARGAITAPRQRELSNARTTLDRNLRKLSDATNKVAVLASQVGCGTDLASVEAEIQAERARFEDLSRARDSMDAAPAMRSLLGEVSVSLEDAELRGLGSEVALQDPETNVELTVSEVRSGMGTRRDELEGLPPAPEAREVVEQLRLSAARLVQLEALEGLVNDALTFERRVANNRLRVADAIAALNSSATGDIEAIEERWRETDVRLLELAADRAVIIQQMGGADSDTTEQTLKGQFKAALSGLGLSQSELPERQEEAEVELDVMREEAQILQHGLSGARRDLARSEAGVRRTWETLVTSTSLGWLMAAESPTAGTHTSGVEDQLEVIDRLRERAEKVADRVGALRGQLGAVGTALAGIGRHLREKEVGASEYVEELQTWLGRRFGDWFSSDTIRREMWPQAIGPIAVDIATREVRWEEPSGSFAKPLEAFSSGEQAYAYTMARLAMLDELPNPPTNRLIVLDEFGAFIAEDRLSQLIAELHSRLATNEGDQVVVVLPLASDYRALANSVVGPESKQYEALAAQVDTVRYAVTIVAGQDGA